VILRSGGIAILEEPPKKVDKKKYEVYLEKERTKKLRRRNGKNLEGI
jgi:hypothetical protein